MFHRGVCQCGICTEKEYQSFDEREAERKALAAEALYFAVREFAQAHSISFEDALRCIVETYQDRFMHESDRFIGGVRESGNAAFNSYIK